MINSISDQLIRLKETEQDLRKDLNSLYNSHSLGPLIETRCERLSANLQDVQNQIKKLEARVPKKESKKVVCKTFADLKNYKIGG